MPQESDWELKTTGEKALVYLIDKLNELGVPIDGRKKIIKLMFLVEHYDPRKPSRLSERRHIGNKFVIYRYGVFSFDVQEDYFDLDKIGAVTEDPTIEIKERSITRHLGLSDKLKSRIDHIIDDFGYKSGATLEIKTLQMLGLNKDIKMNYFGTDVVELIRLMNSKQSPLVAA